MCVEKAARERERLASALLDIHSPTVCVLCRPLELILHLKSLKALKCKTRPPPSLTPDSLETGNTGPADQTMSSVSLHSRILWFHPIFPVSFLPSALMFLVHTTSFFFILVTVLNSKLACRYYFFLAGAEKIFAFMQFDLGEQRSSKSLWLCFFTISAWMFSKDPFFAICPQ